MKYLRMLLFPFSLIYGAVVWCRNRLYDRGWLRQTGFDEPVIVVGNLEVGGTGKSPMTEYLIRLLKERYRLATLSRGYGRRTKGFLEVAAAMDARDVGDEPLQFKQKFPDITVAVAEDRVAGIRLLREGHRLRKGYDQRERHDQREGHELFLLDDAYQHRALKPGFSVLLFDYHRLDAPPFLLPAGNLRDQLRERRRADIMVVTKCPADLGQEVKRAIRKRLEVPGKNIPVFFAGIDYGTPIPYFPDALTLSAPFPAEFSLDRVQQALIVTGIARPAPFVEYVKTRVPQVAHLAFPDHHPFSTTDLYLIGRRFGTLKAEAGQKIILTTEKDRMRLMAGEFATQMSEWPIYYIPIRMTFQEDDGAAFDRRVLDYCRLAPKNR